MSEPFLGEIKMVGFTFAPRGWALCNGQILPISQHTALFSLLGTTYGGDGRTSFGLPDLRGRLAMHAGQGPGLSNRRLGQKSGTETTTLTVAQLPAHSHTANAVKTEGDSATPDGKVWAKSGLGDPDYDSGSPDSTLGATAIASTGGSQAHNNLPPYLVLNFVIALQGIYPSRS